ncbi:MAG: hypothetical protein ACK5H2_00075 [Beutenbergiaceae bacterium]
MTTTDAPVDQPTTPAKPPGGRSNNGWVAVLATVAGAVVVAVVLVQGFVAGLVATEGGQSSRSQPVAGVQALELDVAAAEMTVTFGAVDEAVLDVDSQGWQLNRQWRFEVVSNTLVVEQGGPWGWSFPAFNGRTQVTLTLPNELQQQLDAELDVAAGSTTIVGDFRDVDIDVAAGSLSFDGASTALNVDISSGSASVDTDGPSDVDIEVSAGRAVVSIAGDAPDSTAVQVSAGQADVWLPDADYAITGEVSAGDREINVRSDSGSRHQLDVSVSAGRATVEYTD